jgi:hypothetical protein
MPADPKPRKKRSRVRVSIYAEELQEKVELVPTKARGTGKEDQTDFMSLRLFFGRDLMHGDEDDDTSAVCFHFNIHAQQQQEAKMLQKQLRTAVDLLDKWIDENK